MLTHPLAVLAVLAGIVALGEWLAARPGGRLLGSALLVILLTAVAANAGLIPSVTEGSVVYDGIFGYLAPLAIFWLLLGVNLRGVLAAGLPMLGAFALGAAGTLAGVLLAMTVVGSAFGDLKAALGGMFVGTYIGGSLNFNAVALEYGVQREGLVYAGAGVVDNLMTTLWMIVTIAVPRLLRVRGTGRDGTTTASARAQGAAPSTAAILPGAAEAALRVAGGRRRGAPATPPAKIAIIDDHHDDHADDDAAPIPPVALALLVALGAGALYLAERLTALLDGAGMRVPQILVLTTLALCLAQWPRVQRLRGARPLGMFSVLLFLAAIGALCDVAQLASTGSLGVGLVLLVLITVAVHALVLGLGSAVLRIDWEVAAVASQANIGGSTSALALARGLERMDLVAPALLVGALGNAIGTYLGFLAAGWLN